MALFRRSLPQLSGHPYLTDAGIETDLIFNHGIEIREFAAHTLLETKPGREAVANYLREFLRLARTYDTEFILDSQTWKAHMHWANDLGARESDLHAANIDAIRFLVELRNEFSRCDPRSRPGHRCSSSILHDQLCAPGSFRARIET